VSVCVCVCVQVSKTVTTWYRDNVVLHAETYTNGQLGQCDLLCCLLHGGSQATHCALLGTCMRCSLLWPMIPLLGVSVSQSLTWLHCAELAEWIEVPLPLCGQMFPILCMSMTAVTPSRSPDGATFSAVVTKLLHFAASWWWQGRVTWCVGGEEAHAVGGGSYQVATLTGGCWTTSQCWLVQFTFVCVAQLGNVFFLFFHSNFIQFSYTTVQLLELNKFFFVLVLQSVICVWGLWYCITLKCRWVSWFWARCYIAYLLTCILWLFALWPWPWPQDFEVWRVPNTEPVAQTLSHVNRSSWPARVLQMSMQCFAPAGVLHLKQNGYQQR